MRNKTHSSVWDRFPKLKSISKEKFPNHLLIIPDGNGRWAQRFSKLPVFGHRKGREVLKQILDDLQELPIHFITVWGFSTGNWKRSKAEVKALMSIFEKAVNENLPRLIETGTRFIHIGREDRIPKSLKNAIRNSEIKTKTNRKRVFCLAIDFGGEDQELRMMEKIRDLPKNIKITPQVVEKLRDAQGLIPQADLIIRTSGEQRTSDLGWLERNSEFYSIKKLLPMTATSDFIEAIIDYSKRNRRFGARPK
ncbi:MAG: di-trans,poly-cis-decaprenylcistransferase [Candidatus Levybacteria bacterium]|nr:di-trans,poly-cis-decaprenylcistransferase [Candidatus Levybacteria bacterium]